MALFVEASSGWNVASPPSHEGQGSEVLIVDDNPVDRRLAAALVEKTARFPVLCASHGKEALGLIDQREVAVVVTDMHMPEMNGLELVEVIRARYPHIPVVLMTAYGNEELAIQALQAGASHYVNKRSLAKDLITTLEQVLGAVANTRSQRQIKEGITELQIRYILDNDPALITPLVCLLQEYASELNVVTTSARIRLGVALEEALLNGLYHGNLGISSELRQDGGNRFQQEAARRRLIEPFRNRRLNVLAKFDRDQACITIRDEGDGFDVSRLPDPTDPANMERVGGRGMLLIRTFMDVVRFNSIGNEITLLIKREGKGSWRSRGKGAEV